MKTVRFEPDKIVLQSIPCHGKNSLFVFILDNNNNITRAITAENVQAEKFKRDKDRREVHHLHRRYFDPEQGDRDVDPSSALAS